MKKYCFFFLLFFMACKSMPSVEIFTTPNKITLTGLECLELSENIKPASSGDDEILLLYFLAENDSIILAAWHSSFLEFDRDTLFRTINKEIIIPDKKDVSLKIFLVEQDNYNEEEAIFNLIKNNITKSEKEIRILILNDDLLGLQEIKFNQKIPQKLIFKGIHALDKYEYRLGVL